MGQEPQYEVTAMVIPPSDDAQALSNQWVSVDERLPEDDILVLAHFADADDRLCYSTAYRKWGTWNVPDDFFYDCKIDYWMPIPAVPQLNPEKEER